MKLNVASQNSQVAKLVTNHAASLLKIHSGTIPATQGAAMGTTLVTHTLAGFGAPSNGSVLANAIADAVIAVAGTPTHASISNGTETLLLTLGLSGSGAEVIVSSTTYVLNGNSQVVSLTLSQPSGW
jgi:hypothetical protein